MNMINCPFNQSRIHPLIAAGEGGGRSGDAEGLKVGKARGRVPARLQYSVTRGMICNSE